MPTIITAGDAVSGASSLAGGNDGLLSIIVGPAGSKVTALSIDALGKASLPQGSGGGFATLQTAQNTTSGTSVNFLSIPSWAKKITMNWIGASSNGTGGFTARIGTSAGVVSTGYVGSLNITGTVSNYTSGIGIFENTGSTAANLYNIRVVWTLVDAATNKWMGEAIGSDTLGTQGYRTAIGSITLPGVADRVQFTTIGGTDVFDAGSANILIEG